MLAQGNQGSRVRGPIASLNSLVGASPAKSRQLLPQLSVPSVTGLSLSPVLEVVCCRESTRTRWGGRPSLLGRWNTEWGIVLSAFPFWARSEPRDRGSRAVLPPFGARRPATEAPSAGRRGTAVGPRHARQYARGVPGRGHRHRQLSPLPWTGRAVANASWTTVGLS